MLVVLVQESFRLEGQEHPSSSQSWRENDTDEDTSSALSPDDNPQYALDFDIHASLRNSITRKKFGFFNGF
jgi:hypothetical protein